MNVREFHLVDVENLLGDAYFGASDVAALRIRYDHASRTAGTAQVVIGTSSAQGLLEAGLGWTGARSVWRAGPDGADLALFDVGAHEKIATRFNRIVIGSGDGIFASLAAEFQAAGCHVTIISQSRALSRKLRIAVRDVRYLPSTPPAEISAIRSAA